MELSSSTTGEVLRIEAVAPGPPFMAAVRHSVEDLSAAAHDVDLPPSSWLRVHVDAAHRGLGTASCGPDVRPEYRLPSGRYEFAYRLRLTRSTSPSRR